MAQKTEKEETEFKVPETLTLCVNNCGFTGNPATDNMCQNCFNAAGGIHKPPTTPSPPQKFACTASIPAERPDPAVSDASPPPPAQIGRDLASDRDLRGPAAVTAPRIEVNRCSGCRRKVGLTGFRCRCGELFCAKHRYSDRHDCSYDYKSAGREAIARENPVVRAAKIVRV